MTLFGKESAAEAMREAPGEFAVEEMKSKSEVLAAIAEVGGHNLLSEHGFLESSHRSGDWLEHLQSEIVDDGAALKITQGGKTVGIALADKTGTITRFYALEGKKEEVFEKAVKKLKDKGFDRPSVKITKKSEDMRKMLRGTDFREGEETEDGKILFTKE